jgi:hypothetical protein
MSLQLLAFATSFAVIRTSLRRVKTAGARLEERGALRQLY